MTDITNVLGGSMADSDVFTQAETALCIWEHVLESIRGENLDGLDVTKEWFNQHEGVFNGRMNAINLAYLVDIAYETGQGGEANYRLDGHAFDWEIVPMIVSQFMERTDSPTLVTVDMAIEVGNQLPELL